MINKVINLIKRILSGVRNRFITVITLSFVYPFIYKKYSSEPVDENKVVFMVTRLPYLTNSFHCLYDTLYRETDFTLNCHFLRNNFVSKSEYIKRCISYIKDIATAKYIFLDEASHVTSKINMRKETVVTQLWHGCGAFKKFGYSTAEASFGANKKTMDKYPPNKNYTHVTVSSPEVIPFFEEAMGYENKKGVVKATGCSRTDIFFDEEFICKAFDKLRNLFPLSAEKKVILYAPTFRGNVENAASPDKLDINLLSEKLGNDYVLIMKHHPITKSRPEIPSNLENVFAVDFTEKMNIEELICVSDICISDYSSLIFEYSLFEKPMLFFAYDLKDYFNERGFYYNYDELTPGPIVTDTTEIINHIRIFESGFDAEPIRQFKNKFMSGCDGNATKRIIDLVFGDKYFLNKKDKPLIKNIYHKIPSAEDFHKNHNMLDKQ